MDAVYFGIESEAFLTWAAVVLTILFAFGLLVVVSNRALVSWCSEISEGINLSLLGVVTSCLMVLLGVATGEESRLHAGVIVFFLGFIAEYLKEIARALLPELPPPDVSEPVDEPAERLRLSVIRGNINA